MKKKELKVLGLSYSQTEIGSYICVLSEKRGGRKIPIIIKPLEAQKIAVELEGIKSSRPSAHDFIKSVFDSFLLDIQEVYIHSLLEGVFHTKVITSNGVEEVEIETSVGDALALSIMFKCPVYTNEEILNNVGIIIGDDGTTKDDVQDEQDEFDSFIDNDYKEERVVSIEDLEKLMKGAIENEEYEIADEIRDRINKLKRTDV